MFRHKIAKAAFVLCVAFMLAGKSHAQTTNVAAAKGLAGKWDVILHWKGETIRNIFTFEVQNEATPPPEVRVRFTGTLASKDTPNRTFAINDGEIIGNQFSFTMTEKKGKEWKEDQLVSIYTGTFEGDHLKMIYLNVEPRDPANPNKAEQGPHRVPPPNGDINMHIETATRISK